MQDVLFLGKVAAFGTHLEDLGPGLVREERRLFPSLRPMAATLQSAER